MHLKSLTSYLRLQDQRLVPFCRQCRWPYSAYKVKMRPKRHCRSQIIHRTSRLIRQVISLAVFRPLKIVSFSVSDRHREGGP